MFKITNYAVFLSDSNFSLPIFPIVSGIICIFLQLCLQNVWHVTENASSMHPVTSVHGNIQSMGGEGKNFK